MVQVAVGQDDVGHFLGVHSPLPEGGIDPPFQPRNAGIDQEGTLIFPDQKDLHVQDLEGRDTALCPWLIHLTRLLDRQISPKTHYQSINQG